MGEPPLYVTDSAGTLFSRALADAYLCDHPQAVAIKGDDPDLRPVELGRVFFDAVQGHGFQSVEAGLDFLVEYARL